MRLKIAVQKSGRLTDSSLDLLSRCGLKYSRGKDQLMCYGENMPLDVLFVRDDDIPDLVQEDVCDLGLVGLNVIEEKRLAFAARGLKSLFETVQLLDFLGPFCRATLRPDAAAGLVILSDFSANAMRDLDIREGQALTVALPPELLRVFDDGAEVSA